MKKLLFSMPDGCTFSSYEEVAKWYDIPFSKPDTDESNVEAVLRATKLITERCENDINTVEECEKQLVALKKIKELGELEGDEEDGDYIFGNDNAELNQAFEDSGIEASDSIPACVLNSIIEQFKREILGVKIGLDVALSEEEKAMWEECKANMAA